MKRRHFGELQRNSGFSRTKVLSDSSEKMYRSSTMRVSIFLFFCGCSAFLQSVSAAVVQVILDSSPWCQSGASFGGRCRSLHGLPALFVASHTFLIPDGNVANDDIAGLPAGLYRYCFARCREATKFFMMRGVDYILVLNDATLHAT